MVPRWGGSILRAAPSPFPSRSSDSPDPPFLLAHVHPSTQEACSRKWNYRFGGVLSGSSAWPRSDEEGILRISLDPLPSDGASEKCTITHIWPFRTGAGA